MTSRGAWRLDDTDATIGQLEMAGLSRIDAERAVIELRDQLVTAAYYVPTQDELYRQYHQLGAAYLRGRINAGWVMCYETHKALRERYSDRRYTVMPDMAMWREHAPNVDEIMPVVRTIMEARRWDDPGTLFGMPIRIDPVARSPVWEILGP